MPWANFGFWILDLKNRPAIAGVTDKDCLPPSAFRLLPSAFCLLPSAFRLPPSDFRLTPSAVRLPPTSS